MSITLIGIAVVLTIAYFIKEVLVKPKKLNFPVAEGEPLNGDWSAVLKDATRKYPDEPFIFPLDPPYVVLPSSMISFIKDVPESRCSTVEDVYVRLHGKYSGIGNKHHDVIGAVKNELTRSIASTLSGLQDEIKFAVDQELGECNEWTALPVYMKTIMMVARISARIFVGLPLCRNEKWLRASIMYTSDSVAVTKEVGQYHPLIRPIIGPWLPKKRNLDAYRSRAGKMIEPQVKDLLAKRKANGNQNQRKAAAQDLEEGREVNMSDWLLNHQPDIEKTDVEFLGQKQILVAFAAIHTTGMNATNMIFNLAAYPQYVPVLLKELDDVLTEDELADGKLLKTSIPKLKKLDSFLQESMRYNPPSLGSMFRRVMDPKGLNLPTGHHIPFGTHIFFIHPYHQDTMGAPPPGPLTTPGQPPLEEFYPWRFSDLREKEGHETAHQFVTTSSEHIEFGQGNQACPGGFFASNEIKVILVELIKTFEMALGPNGEGLEDGFKRPQSVAHESGYHPDTKAAIYVKRKKL